MKILKALTVISIVSLTSTALAAPRYNNRVTQEQSNPVTVYNDYDNSSSAFFRQEYERTQRSSTNVATNTRRNVVSRGSTVAVAKQYEGLHAHRNRGTLRNLMDIDPARIAWCAGFVNAILEKTGVSGTDSLMARSFLNWGTSTRNPKEGDVVVFARGKSRSTGHVGFYVGEKNVGGVRYILVLGGNQGKAVNVAYYPAYKVLGYRTIG